MLELSDGSSVWHRTTGTGPTIVNIHGSGFGHRNFAMLTPHLTDDFTVVDFDLPGYGQSTAAGPVGLAEWADYTAEVIGLVADGPVHIHGTSMGALVALHLASRHPELVDRLILTCCMFRYDNAARFMRQTWKHEAATNGMQAAADLTAVSGFSRSFFDRPDALEIITLLHMGMAASDPAAFIAGTESLEASDLSPLLGTIRSRTMLIAGDEDDMTPSRPAPSGSGYADALAQIREVEEHTIEQSGHYLVLERPEAVATLITTFLAS